VGSTISEQPHGSAGSREVTTMTFVSRGFKRREGPAAPEDRLPPGQYLTRDFPVLSAGPTPRIGLDEWRFEVAGEVDQPRGWSWAEFTALPADDLTVDIHCVTKWSKLDTRWKGVSIDTLLEGVRTSAAHTMVHSFGGYTTNLPLEDLRDHNAWVAYQYDGEPLEPEHGGPARLLVPHLYFWKSAKWVRAIELRATDAPGFWEGYGYHNYGDPWREQRYSGD
jgi:DMSO/TMAO reductase YedYZ molybdopterin-dependent catalytic subunit